MEAAKGSTVALTDKDAVDVDALRVWLHDRDVFGRAIGDIVVTRFPAGHSNLTYLVDGPRRSVVLRAPPPGAATIGGAGHDMVREARILQRLKPVYDKVPAVLGVQESAEGSPLGVPFYAMEKIEGRVLRQKKPKDLELTPAIMRKLTEGFVDELAGLHGVDVGAAGLADIGKPEGYVQRQVDGWVGRYEKAKTDEISDLENAATWLKANTPTTTSGPATVVHNDFKLDNLVLDAADPTKIVAVLDWELSTLGEPLTDLGTSLAYWVEAKDGDDVKALPMGLTWLDGALTRQQIVGRWEEKTGRTASHLLFYYVLASFKVATIAQQIYARYVKGFTKDERFALLGFATAVIGGRIARSLEAGSVDAG